MQTMVTVCQTCGDRGFEDALIYCDKCRNYALHLYCLNVPAENIFDEDMTWLCEDCEPKIVKPSTIRSKENPYNNMLKKRRFKKKKSDRWTTAKYVAKKKGKACEGTKKKVKTCEGTKKKVKTCEGTKRPVHICEGAKMKVQICEGSPSVHEAEGSNNCDSGQNVGNECREVVLKDHISSFHELATSVKPSQITTIDAIQIIEHNSYVAAQPIVDPIWRGSLSMFNKDFNIISGVVAHLSSLACPKVREEAELLPLLLFPELVPRTDVWPKAFQKLGPSDQSIALYFFPENERDEKDFDCLVTSMIQDDLAMKAVLDNAELLVFTSIVLPEQYQTFQAKIYLWGVFRAKKFPQLTNDNVAGGEKDLAMPLTCYGHSPVSTLSNNVDTSCDIPESHNSFCSSLM